MRYILGGSMGGGETTAMDPQRLVWFATDFKYCGYWTDDWDNLKRTAPKPDKPRDTRTAGHKHGVFCCPSCYSEGMQIPYCHWIAKAQGFQEKDHPRYVEFLLNHKNQCGYETHITFLQRYANFIIQENLDDQAEGLPDDDH